MNTLIDQVAEVLYSTDSPPFPWDKAMPEDVDYFNSVAEVVIDTVVDFLKAKDAEFGGLTTAIDYIGLSVEAARLRRLASAQ